MKVLRQPVSYKPGTHNQCQIVIEEGSNKHRYSCEFYVANLVNGVLVITNTSTGVRVAGVRAWDRWYYEQRIAEGIWHRTSTLEWVEKDADQSQA